jgi:aminopeptidase YwaD
MEEMMFSHSTMQHLRNLTGFGPRPIGSAANQSAADYIRDHFLSLGYHVEEQPYPCTAYEGAQTELSIDGQPASVEGNPFSLPCDVEGMVLPLGSLAELDKADSAGRILLLYGELAQQPLSPKSWFLKGERDDRIIQRLESGRPAAVLAPPAATEEYMHLTMDWELQAATATIPLPTVLRLLQEPRLRVRLRIQGERRPAVARNIVARTGGTDGTRRVVLCAHFDTMINTPGAMDNASGVAALLALGEHLKDYDLPYGLEFVAFNGEEYLPIGDDEYVRRAGDSFDKILYAINMDGIGPAYASSSITMLAADETFQAKVAGTAAAYPEVVWVEPWPESNHSTFAMRGIPAIAFSSLGARRLAHTPGDRVEIISAEKMEEVCRLAAEIVVGWS